MKSFIVKAKNRKAKKLLKSLAALGLISMHTNKKSQKIKKALDKLRKKMAKISFDEITAEVEQVRTERHVIKKA
ncbi:hypothetical protein BH09BAC1_BH09BAC1_28290 [soil metagenome]